MKTESLVDEDLNQTHYRYDEFERKQFIVELDVGETLRVQVLDKEGKTLHEKEFIAKYINCHINCQWQDKGVKKTELINNIKK